MFNATQYIIDKVRRITQINLATGLVDFTGTSVASPQIEFTGESTDKTDAQGILLARFDTAKGVTFSGELSLLNLSLMAAQLGSEVQVASESKKVTGADFTVLTVVDDGTNKTVTLKHEPKTVPAAVYTLSEDKNINGTIEIGTEEGNAQIDGMQMLINENNELVINRDRINNIIEAKTRQLAVEQALSYVERLRLAATGASNESLDQLCFATTQATNSTWGLVYAELALMQQTGLLNGEQYQAALHNIQAIQSLAETAVLSSTKSTWMKSLH